MRCVSTGVLIVVVSIGAIGCYEVPPVFPSDYGPIEIRGWPAPAAYSNETSAPLNRWFQRSFGRRADDGSIASCSSAATCSEMLDPTALDRFEVESILDVLLEEADSSRAEMDAVTRRILASDLYGQSAYWRARDRDDLARKHDDLARRVSSIGSANVPELAQFTPPPLREGSWRRVTRERAGESPADRPIRSVEVYYETSSIEAGRSLESMPVVEFPQPERAVLTFTRRFADGQAFVDEAWELRAGEPTTFRVFRVDRSLWRSTRRLWRSIDESEEHTWELPISPKREFIVSTVTPACRRCHSDDFPILSFGKEFSYGYLHEASER